MITPQELIDDVKNYLGVTWDDARLEKQIEDARSLIESYSGTTIDFFTNPPAYELLRAYVRYTRNHAEEWFEENFKSRLLNLQYQEAIKSEETINGKV